MTRPSDHHINCDWQLDQYEDECNCGAAVLSAPACRKCALKASSMLHRFCTHPDCPVREAIAQRQALNAKES